MKQTKGSSAQSLMEVLASLPDPRSLHGRRHPLGAILGLAVCAMLCGARSLYAISQWGRDQGREVKCPKPLGLPGSVPHVCPPFIWCLADWTESASSWCWGGGFKGVV